MKTNLTVTNLVTRLGCVVLLATMVNCGFMESEDLPEEQKPPQDLDAVADEAISFGDDNSFEGELVEAGGLPGAYSHTYVRSYLLTLEKNAVIHIETSGLKVNCEDESKTVKDVFFSIKDLNYNLVATTNTEAYPDSASSETVFPGELAKGNYLVIAMAYSTGRCKITKNFSFPEPKYEEDVKGYDSLLVGSWETDYHHEGVAYHEKLNIDDRFSISHQVYHDQVKVLEYTSSLGTDSEARPRRAQMTVEEINKANTQSPPQIEDVLRCIYFVDSPNNPRYLTWQCHDQFSATFPEDFANTKKKTFAKTSQAPVIDYYVDLDARPDKYIPDNDFRGISQKFAVNSEGSLIADIGITVDINHYNIGDLKVVLIHPDGTEVVLHNQSGGTKNHITKTWGMHGIYHTGLRDLVGRNINGSWTVKVYDKAPFYDGTLKYVRLHIGGLR